MAKRILAWLITLSLLTGMVILPASATETETTAVAETCPCGCGETLSDVQWLPYDINTKGSLDSGHYYLESDYEQDKQYTIQAGKNIVIDLRGNTLTTAELSRLYLLYGSMAVVDTVGGGMMASTPTGSGNGGLMMVSKDSSATQGGVFELYSGTMTQQGENGALDGGIAVVAADCTFRMHGGKIVDAAGRLGGALAGRADSTIEILGGGIYGCSATSNGGNIYSLGTTVLKNCEILGGVSAGYGGNICQPGGTLTVENCAIGMGEANGTSNGGGNICTYTSTTSITNCRIFSGYAKYNGGNLLIGSGTHELKDCTVYGGTGENSGGNLATINASAKLTIDNCSFTGDVRITRGTVTFKNKVTIGLLNTGLNMVHTDGKTLAADFSGLTEGSEIYVNAAALFTTGSVNPAYFKGALRTVITETAEGLVGTQAESGTQGGYCPHCNTQVVWNAFSTTGSVVQECYHDADNDTDPTCTGKHIETGHYYLDQDYSSFIQYKVGAYRNSTALASEDVVIDLNGHDLGGAYRAFYLHPGKGDVPDSTLTLLDSYGGATVTGDGSNAQGGGVIYNESSNLNIYGGIYRYKVNASRVVKGGSVLFNSGVLNIYGGVFDGSAYENTEQVGGTVYTTSGGKTVNISGGLFIGGTAKDGGTMYIGYNNQTAITGGILRNGNATESGGNLRVYSSGSTYDDGTLTLRDVAFRDGQAGKSAGNLDIQYCTSTVENCLFMGGNSDGYAGNVNLAGSGDITMDSCVLMCGTATKGGNLYFATTNTDILLKDSYIYGGIATTENGGNLRAGNGRATIESTEFAFGSAPAGYGGNIYSSTGNASATSDNFTRLGTGTSLLSGDANYGGNIALKGVTYLDDVTMLGGQATTAGQDAFLCSLGNQQLLTIGEEFTGSFLFYAHASHLADPVYGAPISNTACQTLNGTILFENLPDQPELIAVNGQLGLSAYCVIGSDGTATGYDTVAAAIAACDENSYVKLFADADITLTKDCAIDINGCKVTVSGDYTLYGMDASGDGFAEPAGKLTAAEETTVAADYTAPNGHRYLYLEGGFHRIEVRITDVNLRPSVDGIYYNGTWCCDDTVKAQVASYGVAVSLNNMPGSDFASEDENLFTSFEGATLICGEKKPGAIISGILKQDNTPEDNDWNAKANIFATAYMTLANGTTLISDKAGYGDDIYFSMYSLLQTLDNLIATTPKAYAKSTKPARAFYEKWESLMAAWELKKIPAPEDDGVIDLLMIGNSFSHYFVQELYAIAEAAGVPMRVCNLYYGGCSLQQHYTWWLDDSAPYNYYNTDGNGRVGTDDVSLEWALAQQDWDVISIQEVSSKLRSLSAEEELAQTALYRQTLIPYLQNRFPDATVYWQQTWAYQKGFTSSSYTCDSVEEQKRYAEQQKLLALAVCEEFGINRVPSGAAWEIIRDSGYDEMCDRLGKADGDDPHAGDYYHDGDIGGGQYLNACVWFETITGQSVVGNTYVPTYVYKDVTYNLNAEITVEALQNAAHQAVAEMRAES